MGLRAGVKQDMQGGILRVQFVVDLPDDKLKLLLDTIRYFEQQDRENIHVHIRIHPTAPTTSEEMIETLRNMASPPDRIWVFPTDHTPPVDRTDS